MMKLSKVNKEQRLYVMPCGGGYSCYGFDVLDRKARALTAELIARGHSVPAWNERKGTKKAFYHYATLIELASDINRRTGYRFAYELTKQLMGLEGFRVEVVTTYGETRRFWVGKSTGFTPIHLEICRRNSSGGGGADHEYKSVVVIARGR